MSDLPFGPPVKVSPLIRFGRWSFLTAGILYGAFHQSRLSKKETKLREIEAKEKVIRDAKMKEEKARAAAAEMKALEEMIAKK
ncbi:ATP synthase subunit e, mitochondrial [Vanessa tameamea]|uniref:ATP synthase F(0) complex subunit e, mitochondrial n=1 Tax=Vanessa tameamea TaxID=334116 RepID=A0A8B8HPC6_VANTA|nr:ATP synthase subunit e, mitochondrial [Vanessa tameamea]XP_047541998.1 ATP synthase subunit e, mitochondrial [Vanessa atalanta]